jgi:hypothetical protein
MWRYYKPLLNNDWTIPGEIKTFSALRSVQISYVAHAVYHPMGNGDYSPSELNTVSEIIGL